MEESKLKALLDEIASGHIDVETALTQLRTLPFEDLGFAKLDHHRMIRTGYPETIFCESKAPDQVAEIVTRMRAHKTNVFGTRCSREIAERVKQDHPDTTYYEEARAITIIDHPLEMLDGYVAVCCAGTSDIPVAEEAVLTLEVTGNRAKRVYDVGVAGIHRLLGKRNVLDDANAVIVCAGMEGALPTVVAGLIRPPVIAVPTSVGYGTSFKGVAPLVTMLNSCASGLAVVNIDGGYSAGMFAASINRIANESNRKRS